jgi:hypothetical protein
VEGEEVYRRRWWILAVLWRGGCGDPCRFRACRGTELTHPSPGFRLSFRKLRVTEDHWRRRELVRNTR